MSASVRSSDSHRSYATEQLTKALRQRRDLLRGAVDASKAAEEISALRERIRALENERASLATRVRRAEAEKHALERDVEGARAEAAEEARARFASVVARHRDVLARMERAEAALAARVAVGSLKETGKGGKGGADEGSKTDLEVEEEEDGSWRDALVRLPRAAAVGIGARAVTWTEGIASSLQRHPPLVHLLGTLVAVAMLVAGVWLARAAVHSLSRGGAWMSSAVGGDATPVVLVGLSRSAVRAFHSAVEDDARNGTFGALDEFVGRRHSAVVLPGRALAVAAGATPCRLCFLYLSEWPSLWEWPHPPLHDLLSTHVPLVVLAFLVLFFLRAALRGSAHGTVVAAVPLLLWALATALLLLLASSLLTFVHWRSVSASEALKYATESDVRWALSSASDTEDCVAASDFAEWSASSSAAEAYDRLDGRSICVSGRTWSQWLFPLNSSTPTTSSSSSSSPNDVLANATVLVGETVPAWTCPLVLVACALPPPLVLLAMVAASPAARRELRLRFRQRVSAMAAAATLFSAVTGHVITVLVVASLTDAPAAAWLFRFNVAHALVGIGARLVSAVAGTAPLPVTSSAPPDATEQMFRGLFHRAATAALSSDPSPDQDMDAFVSKAAAAAASILSGTPHNISSSSQSSPTDMSFAPAGLLRVSPGQGVDLLVPDVHPYRPLALLLFWAPLLWSLTFLLPLLWASLHELVDECDVVGILIRTALGAARARAAERKAAIAGSPPKTSSSSSPTSSTTTPQKPPKGPAVLRLALTAACLVILITWYRLVTLRQPWGLGLDAPTSAAARELGTPGNTPEPATPAVPGASGAPPGWPALLACPALLVAAAHLAAVAKTFANGYQWMDKEKFD